jgi:hypothetical protein
MTSVTSVGTSRFGCALVAVAVSVAGLLPWPGTSSDSGEAQRPRSSYGHTSAPGGTLRPGCHNYTYRYSVDVRSGDWTLETFLRDPRGAGLASGVFAPGSDPRRGRATFRFCRNSTKAGKFTIRAHLHWYTGADSTEHDIWLKPSHFRLKRP